MRNDLQHLVTTSLPFLNEIVDMTAGTEAERWLYPEARGGAVIALFFLPAGRIAYPLRNAS